MGQQGIPPGTEKTVVFIVFIEAVTIVIERLPEQTPQDQSMQGIIDLRGEVCTHIDCLSQALWA